MILGDFPKRPSEGRAAVIDDKLFIFGGNSQNEVAKKFTIWARLESKHLGKQIK